MFVRASSVSCAGSRVRMCGGVLSVMLSGELNVVGVVFSWVQDAVAVVIPVLEFVTTRYVCVVLSN